MTTSLGARHSAVLGAFRAQMELGIGAIGKKKGFHEAELSRTFTFHQLLFLCSNYR